MGVAVAAWGVALLLNIAAVVAVVWVVVHFVKKWW